MQISFTHYTGGTGDKSQESCATQKHTHKHTHNHTHTHTQPHTHTNTHTHTPTELVNPEEKRWGGERWGKMKKLDAVWR